MLFPLPTSSTVFWSSRRRRAGLARAAAGVLLNALATTGVLAQDSSHVHLASGQTHGIESAVVQVRPAAITVDPTNHTATVQFINSSADTVHADVTLQDTLPRNSVADADVSPTVSTTDTRQSDSAAKRWSLASWIRDVPTQLTLAPHERRTVTLHLTVPPGLTSGDYAAYMIVSSGSEAQIAQGNMMQQMFGGMGGMKFSNVKVRVVGGAYNATHLVYHVAGH